MHDLINPCNFPFPGDAWAKAKPFSHLIIDDFLTSSTARRVAEEFPCFSESIWHEYENAVEIKRVMNSWDRFGPTTYRLIWHLNSNEFISQLEHLTACKLYPDFGLHGSGLHAHRSGGKLNTHLDYSLHPKLGLERRLNLLIYLTPDWNTEWGGALGLWDHDEAAKTPKNLVSTIPPTFNRAVLFDTTQNSWHGLPDPIKCPADVTRNSLAIYYLCEPRAGAAERNRALFVPHEEQQHDPDVLALIRQRTGVLSSQAGYKAKP